MTFNLNRQNSTEEQVFKFTLSVKAFDILNAVKGIYEML